MFAAVSEKLLVVWVVMSYLFVSLLEWYDKLSGPTCLKAFMAIWLLTGVVVGGPAMVIYFMIHSCVTLPLWYAMETA
jgi:hypothetical protein